MVNDLKLQFSDMDKTVNVIYCDQSFIFDTCFWIKVFVFYNTEKFFFKWLISHKWYCDLFIWFRNNSFPDQSRPIINMETIFVD